MINQKDFQEFAGNLQAVKDTLLRCDYTSAIPLLNDIKKQYGIKDNQSRADFEKNFNGDEIDILLVEYYYLYEEFKRKTNDGL